MTNLLLSKSLVLVIMMGIVISKEEIMENIAIGDTRQEAEEYLTTIAGEFQFRTREEASSAVPRFPWTESDIGYILAVARNVRTYWWLPSVFGERVLNIRVGISSDGLVTQVVIRGFKNI